MKKVSLNYLRRMSENYDLTLKDAKKIFGDRFEIYDINKKNQNP